MLTMNYDNTTVWPIIKHDITYLYLEKYTVNNEWCIFRTLKFEWGRLDPAQLNLDKIVV